MVPGDVFAVLTTQGNYAKVRVVAYGYNLVIDWVSYQHEGTPPVPPLNPPLALTGQITVPRNGIRHVGAEPGANIPIS